MHIHTIQHDAEKQTASSFFLLCSPPLAVTRGGTAPPRFENTPRAFDFDLEIPRARREIHYDQKKGLAQSRNACRGHFFEGLRGD